MVMKRNAMRKNLRQSILKSMGRYLAITMIIALGAGLFVGLQTWLPPDSFSWTSRICLICE